MSSPHISIGPSISLWSCFSFLQLYIHNRHLHLLSMPQVLSKTIKVALHSKPDQTWLRLRLLCSSYLFSSFPRLSHCWLARSHRFGKIPLRQRRSSWFVSYFLQFLFRVLMVDNHGLLSCLFPFAGCNRYGRIWWYRLWRSGGWIRRMLDEKNPSCSPRLHLYPGAKTLTIAVLSVCCNVIINKV